MPYILGPHISTAKGLHKAAETAVSIGANTFQFFSRNPRGSAYRDFPPDEIAALNQIMRQHRFGPLLAHAPYTLNLASAQDRAYEFACQTIFEDVRRMDAIGVTMLVLHPGSHTGLGTEKGIAKIVAGLTPALAGPESLTVLLETMSSKGTEIGYRFEELAAILRACGASSRLGICLDTCHVFAAGYDIARDLDAVLLEFDRVLGLERLWAIHLNDSLMPLGSRKDRHAPIGQGQIGMEALLAVMRHPVLSHLPFYLETPLSDQEHGVEIAQILAAV